MARPQVLFVHGMWGQPSVWDNWRARFEARGWRCTALALPAHERLDNDAAVAGKGVAEYADAAAQAVARMDAPVLVGHSMGGLIAQMVAARLPLRAAVLVNSAAPAPVFPLRPVMLPGLARHFARWGLWRKSFRLSVWEADHLLFNAVPAGERASWRATLLAESGRIAYQLGFGALNTAHSNRVERERIACPLLALAGARDHIVPLGVSRALASWYGGRLQYWEYAQHGHWLLGEPQWQQHCDEVLQWLEQRAV